MKKEETIAIDNFDLMCFWCRDEYCKKTLGEIIPIYKEHLKQRQSRVHKNKKTMI